MSSLRSIKKGLKPLTDGELAELARAVTLDHQSKEVRQLALMVLLDEIEQASQISAAKLDPANEAGRAAFAVTDHADQARQRLIAAVRKDHNTGDEPLLEIIQSFASRKED